MRDVVHREMFLDWRIGFIFVLRAIPIDNVNWPPNPSLRLFAHSSEHQIEDVFHQWANIKGVLCALVSVWLSEKNRPGQRVIPADTVVRCRWNRSVRIFVILSRDAMHCRLFERFCLPEREIRLADRTRHWRREFDQASIEWSQVTIVFPKSFTLSLDESSQWLWRRSSERRTSRSAVTRCVDGSSQADCWTKNRHSTG